MSAEEIYLREQLADLQRSYQMAAKPFIDRLVAIESAKMPRPIFMQIDEAIRLGLRPATQEGGDKTATAEKGGE